MPFFRIFQFLMVRLKGIFSRIARVMIQISIPYGSIKSKRPVKGLKAKAISIPYGSIKRSWCPCHNVSQKSFQFLMVRLKVHIQQRYTINLRISIPYGSIKRCFLEVPIHSKLFQFLMVRLKDRSAKLYAYWTAFQFLMVRLKVGKRSLVQQELQPFQFLMVRLKVSYFHFLISL